MLFPIARYRILVASLDMRIITLIYPMNNTSLLLQRPTFLGVMTAIFFFCGSLVPGLLPLSWLLQGIISGVWIAIGYSVGTAVGSVFWKIVQYKFSNAIQTIAWMTLFVLGSSISAWSLFVQYEWQVDVRQLMGMTATILHYSVTIPWVAILVAAVLVLIARLIRAAYRRYFALLSRYLPSAMTKAVGLATSLVLVVFMIDKVVGELIFPALNRRYIASELRYDGTINRPTSPNKSGGVGSLVSWETLGVHGQTFVTQGPSVGELANFSRKAAVEPIRIYVGRQSAPSGVQRTELAVAELERTDAFHRELLVIVMPTGTGWVDPYAVAPLEYMYNGNTASVALQYSYLPSWIVMLGNQDLANEGAQALITAVHERLQREPPATRPRLVIYGQSLGAFASESAFTGLDDITQRTDGVLFVGPFSESRLWREFTTHRDQGSPIWKPIYRRGETVRFGFDMKGIVEPTAPWKRPRVVYLQHASDPITWWSVDMLLERPAWLEEPLGPDISKKMTYYPVATFLRVAVDLIFGLGAPPGHGHRYGVSQAEAWTLIIHPEGWSVNDTQRLVTALEARN